MDDETVVRRVSLASCLLDDRGRILLLFYRDRREPADPGYWYLPGGGMDPGESPRDEVQREIREELGLESAMLGPAVHERHGVTFRHEGRAFEQDEWHVLGWWPEGQLGATRSDDAEAESVAAHRWWSISDLEGSPDQVYPADLVLVLRGLPPDLWSPPRGDP